MIVQIVRFQSGLPQDEVEKMYETRASQYRALAGLIQKIYVRYRDTGEYGAGYVWDSEASMQAFRETELAKTIATAYQVQGTPQSQIADVTMVLRTQTEAVA